MSEEGLENLIVAEITGQPVGQTATCGLAFRSVAAPGYNCGVIATNNIVVFPFGQSGHVFRAPGKQMKAGANR